MAEIVPAPPATPDVMTVWPLDSVRVGIDITFSGASGHELASRFEGDLERAGVPFSFRRTLTGESSVRLTLPRASAGEVIQRFLA